MSYSKPYILVAEDDSDDVDFFVSSFSERCPQVTVKHVTNGQAVLDFFNNCSPDNLPSLLLLDYKMPLASAPDILTFLRTKDHLSQMPKAVWSTSGRPTEVEECRGLGAGLFFTKPASLEEWDKLVAEISHYFVVSES